MAEQLAVSASSTPIKATVAAILAGGLGTRLRSVLADRPKVLAPVAGRHFISFLLDQLADAGLGDVVLCTGYKGDQVQEVFGSRFRRLELRYSQESDPRGTGGALLDALPLLRSDSVLVLNGDSYCQTDIAAFLAWHRRKHSQASLVLTHVPDASGFGSVESDTDHHILRFGEKANSAAGWINAGIYALSRDLIASIPQTDQVSLERECFPAWIANGMLGYSSGGRFLDIGTPDTLRAAQEFFAPPSFNAHRPRVVLLDRDGTLIVERNYLHDPAEVELLPGATDALRQMRKLGLSIVLATNQSGIARGLFNQQQLRQIHDRLRALLGDADVALDAIYFCPHLPEQGCNCRKPQPEMIERAARDLGFDPRDAFLVGDKECDVELGRRIGATTLLVQTGYGQQTLSAGAKADYTVQGLAEATAVIARHVKPDAK